MPSNRDLFQSLTNANTVSVGQSRAVDRYRYFSLFVNAASVTTGATLQVQTLSPNGNWVKVQDVPIAANGDSYTVITGNAHEQLRCSITARTDGTYNAWIDCANVG